MKIVQGNSLSSDARSSHRGGTVSYVRLLESEPDTIDGFSLIVAKTPGRFSPRHRHNFEQFRYQIDGIANYGRTGKLKPGMLGYFPEGVHYGPQTQEPGDELTILVLQCGGASGGGYLGRDAEISIAEELKKFGAFEDGVYRRNPGVPGKRNLDAFQAIWEHASGRALEYPQPRYATPVLMYPEGFDWVPVSGAKGVSEKPMGMFTERRISARFVRLEAGAAFEFTGRRELLFVLSGNGEIGGEPLRAWTTALVTSGDKASIRAQEATEMLHFTLPDLSGVSAQKGASRAEAAE